MPQDAAKIKEKIVEFIKSNGPSLPVQIAKQTDLSILFASAFLSELFGDKQIRMSYLRIGSSPLYFLDDQEPQLENFAHFLKSKNKEAFLLLKEKSILNDSEQQPAIRVALREIKDYAFSFHKDEELFWRYFLISEQQVSDYFEKDFQVIEEKVIMPLKEEKQVIEEKEKSKEESLTLETEKKKSSKKEKTPKKIVKKTTIKKNEKKNENFFNKIKEVLAKKEIEIIDIKDFKNDEAIIKVNNKGQEEIIFFYNKKKITDKEILSSFKKIEGEKLNHSIYFFGEPSKKIQDLISAIKNLSNIDKID
jgi:hypothetical protein